MMNSSTNQQRTDYRLLYLIISLTLTFLALIDLTYTYGLNDPGYFYRSTGINQNGVSIFEPIIELFRLFTPGISFTIFLLLISKKEQSRVQTLIKFSYWIGFYIVTFYASMISFGIGVIICGGIGALLINNDISTEKLYPNCVMGLAGSALGLLGLILALNGDYWAWEGVWHDDGEMYLMALMPWQIGIGLLLAFSNKLGYSNKKTSDPVPKLNYRKMLALLFIIILYALIISIT